MGKTYSDNGRIIGHHRGPALLGRLWRVINPQVLDIGAAKDNVVVDLIRGGDLVIGIASAALAAKGLDILERDGRLFGVDLVEDAGVARRELAGCSGEVAKAKGKREVGGGHVPNVAH